MLTVKDPENFDWSTLKLEDCLEGNAQDTFYTLRLYRALMEIAKTRNFLPLFEMVLEERVSGYAHATSEGVLVDLPYLRKLRSETGPRIMAMEDALYDCDNVLKTDNLAPASIARILYVENPFDEDTMTEGENSYNLFPAAVTDAGKVSTDKDSLVDLLGKITIELAERGELT